MPLRDVIAIGGSLGAVAALRRLCADLPSDLPAALFIVVHVGQHVSDLAGGLQSGSALPVISAQDGAQVEPGKIYAYAITRRYRHRRIPRNARLDNQNGSGWPETAPRCSSI
jgi:chemotaxis response regulator CheB